MSSGRLTLIPTLEKLKAGLGAAGMAAVGLEAMLPLRMLGEVAGTAIPILGALVSGVAAAYWVDVPKAEEIRIIDAGRERVLREPDRHA